MRQDQSKQLVSQRAVIRIFKTLIQTNQLAQPAYIFIVLVAVWIHSHLKNRTQKRRKIQLPLQPVTKISTNITRLDSLKYSRQVVKNRPNWLLFGQLSNELVDPELVFIQNIVEVEGNCNFTHLRHDVRSLETIVEILLEKGQHLLKNMTLQKTLTPHVPLQLKNHLLHHLQSIQHLHIRVRWHHLAVQKLKNNIQVDSYGLLRFILFLFQLHLLAIFLPVHHQQV